MSTNTSTLGLGDWKLMFPGLTTVALAGAILTCSERFHGTLAARALIIEVLAFICAAVFFANMIEQEDLFENTLGGLAVLVLPAAAVYFPHPISSTLYYSLIAFSCFAVVSEGKSTEEILRRGSLLFWVCGGALLAVSEIPLFEHSLPFLTRPQVHGFLSARLLLTLAVLLLYIGTAVARVARMNRPEPADLPPSGIEPLQSDDSILNAIMRPISLVACVILDALWAVANIVWKLMVYTWTQLNRLAGMLVWLVADELLNRDDLLRAIKAVVAVLLPLAAFHLAQDAAPFVVAYLRDQPFSSQIHGSFWKVLAYGLGMGVVLVVWFHLVDIVDLDEFDAERFQAVAARAAFCGSMLLVAFAAAGLLNYFVAKQTSLQEVGFENIGPYTFVMLGTLLCMLIYHSAKQVQAKKHTAAHGTIAVPAQSGQASSPPSP